MKETTKTFPLFVEYNDMTMYASACATWRTQFEKEAKERLHWLEQVRAGGFDNHFEEGEKFILKEVLGLSTDKELANANQWRKQIMVEFNKQNQIDLKLKERLDKFDLTQFVYDSNSLVINSAMEKTLKDAIYSVILDLGSVWAKEVAKAFPPKEQASVNMK